MIQLVTSPNTRKITTVFKSGHIIESTILTTIKYIVVNAIAIVTKFAAVMVKKDKEKTSAKSSKSITNNEIGGTGLIACEILRVIPTMKKPIIGSNPTAVIILKGSQICIPLSPANFAAALTMTEIIINPAIIAYGETAICY